MKLRLLAVDFDNTIAIADRLDPACGAALLAARRAGILVVLVTGRILDDLRTLLPTPDLFDAIVAENGAVLWFPRDVRPVVLTHGPDAGLLAELERRGIPHRAGLAVVEASADVCGDVLAVVRALGLPHGLVFNRGALMVLPHGVTKASGLREAAWRLGVSTHNAIAIGDAENDQPMLDACEVGVAVSWGSPALQRFASEVIQGDGPPAVARFIHDMIPLPTIPPRRIHHPLHRIRLGSRADGGPLETEIRGRNALVVGDPRRGKSWIAGLLCEQLVLQRYSLCVVDPEGDYACLEALPGVFVHRVEPEVDGFPTIEAILRQPAMSVVVDLSALPASAKPAQVARIFAQVDALRRALGVPHRVLLDEAHYFLSGTATAPTLDPDLGGYVLVTYRIASIAPDALRACEAIFVTRIVDPGVVAEVLALAPVTAATAAATTAIGTLGIGEAVVLIPHPLEGEAVVTRFRVAPRVTEHVRHRRKYLHAAVRTGAEFVFTVHGRPLARAYSMADFFTQLPHVSEEVFRGHLARGDFHRWIEDVLGDGDLGAKVRAIERAAAPDGREMLLRAVHDRYFDPARA